MPKVHGLSIQVSDNPDRRDKEIRAAKKAILVLTSLVPGVRAAAGPDGSVGPFPSEAITRAANQVVNDTVNTIVLSRGNEEMLLSRDYLVRRLRAALQKEGVVV